MRTIILAIFCLKLCSAAPDAADTVCKHILDGLRITHQVSPIAFSDNLKTIAVSCANYHASVATVINPTLPEPQCAQAASAGAYELLFKWPIADGSQSPSQLYRQALWGWYTSESSLLDYVNYNDNVEHVSQMLWKSSTDFACGISTRTSGAPNPSYYISIIFSPAGNKPSEFADNVFPDFV